MIMPDKILQLRKRQGLTQEELAEALQVSRQSISKWEGGQSIPDISKVMALADFFSVSTDYLLRDEITSLEGELPQVEASDHLRRISIEEANDFLSASARSKRFIAQGVLLCITAVVPMLLLLGFSERLTELSDNWSVAIGLTYLLIGVAMAVGCFIYASMQMEPYQEIQDRKFQLSHNVEGIIKAQQDAFRPLRTRSLIISVSVFITAPLPLLVAGIFSDGGDWPLFMTALMLIAVGLSVYRLIIYEGQHESYDKLLQEADFRTESSASEKKRELLGSMYWSLVLVAYLLWSFLGDAWQLSWLIWPIAGLISPAMQLISMD